ncbi:MAG: hypothetical protein R3E21_12400 [Caenibius sp.]
MSDNFEQVHDEGRGRSGVGLWTLIAVGLTAFLVGAAATVWAVTNGWEILKVEEVPVTLADTTEAPDAVEKTLEPDEKPSPAAAANAAKKVAEVAEVVEKTAEKQGGFDQRIAAMEQRLARLDLQAQAASGNAARAEGLLIAFATRRAIERGAPLGYLADQLRLRFGDARPNAIRTIIEGARSPVTLDQLVARLEGLSLDLTKAPQDEGLWQRFTREMDGLFIIRREASPSPLPRRRLQRAQMFLESGRVEAAVSEVRNMPGASEEQARIWIADAQRYARMQDALDLIETTAVLEPRRLRDGEGHTVEQLSPASAAKAEAEAQAAKAQ